MSKRKTGLKLTRNNSRLENYDRVLIVCEDSKSSPQYFKDLIRTERLSSANVEITGDCGSDPMSVVNKAIEIYEESRRDKNSASTYDEVFCVVDRDAHQNFNQALDKLNQYRNNGYSIHWVQSDPCFEYWYLCHFNRITSPIVKKGNNSSGANCVKLLNIEWKGEFNQSYEKGNPKSYTLLKSANRRDIALSNAEYTLKIALNNQTTNPSTQVHELVRYLNDLNQLKPRKIIYQNKNSFFLAV